MEKIRRNTLLVRWSILSWVMVNFIWVIRYLINKSVPFVDNINMTESWNYQLPFTISTWTDILFAPVLIFGSILSMTWGYEKISKKDKGGSIGGIVACTLLGFVSSISLYNFRGFDAILIVSFALGVYIYMTIKVIGDQGFGSETRMGIGAIVGMSFGIGISTCFAIGIVAGIALGVSAILSIVFTELMRQIFNLFSGNKTFFKKIGRWLIAGDKIKEKNVE